MFSKKKTIALIFVFLSIGMYTIVFAQQIPLYQQYFYNPFIYNPAYAGFDNAANVFLLHRAQWLDMPGKPVTTAITFDAPVKSKDIGLGLSLYNDQTDFNSRIGVYGAFSYKIKINDDQNLLFGFSGGFLENRIDFSRVVVKDVDDPALLIDYQKKKALDGTFGLVYRWKDLQLGMAIPQIFASSFEYSGNNARTYYQLSRHYMASFKYDVFINSERNISITPLFLARFMPEAPLQFDANLIFNWRNIAYLAVSYRSDYAIGANARVKINNRISIGYTYDIISSSINTYSGISHEIMVGYRFSGGNVDESELNELQDRIDSLNNALSASDAELDARYNSIIAKADSLFDAGDYFEAKILYEQAFTLKPDEQYPKNKISEIDGLMDNKYQDLIAKANAMFKSRDYEGAKKIYEEALKYRPDDGYASDRISKIEKIIALFEQRYNTLISTADSLFMAKQHKLAREKYAQALKFNPDAKYPADMITMIDSNKTGGNIRMTKSSDFLDEFGKPALKGFYVVMASFKNKDYADRLKAKKGYKSVFNKARGFHYVYINRHETYDIAKDQLINNARKNASDSWIYILR